MQTVWLLLAAVCGFLTFRYSFYSGNKPGDNQSTNFEHLTATTSMIILVLSVAIISSVLIDIFLYKNRKLQFRILLAAIIASLLNVYLYFRQTQDFVQGTYSLTSVFVFAIPVLLILAARGIYKDQKLVKSLDRLR